MTIRKIFIFSNCQIINILHWFSISELWKTVNICLIHLLTDSKVFIVWRLTVLAVFLIIEIKLMQNKEERTWLYYRLLRIPCLFINMFVFWLWNTFEWFFIYIFFGVILLWIIYCLIYIVYFLSWFIIWILNLILVFLWISKLNIWKKIRNSNLRRSIKQNSKSCVKWIKNGNNVDNLLWFMFTRIAPVLFMFFMQLVYWGNDSWKCYDKTSIDYNRKNDMKCIDRDWNIKRTDYEWAKELMWK